MATHVAPSLAHALWASTEHRGAATTLRHDILNPPPLEPPSEISDFFRCADWEVTRNRDFNEVHHVNLQELNEITDELAEASMRSVRI